MISYIMQRAKYLFLPNRDGLYPIDICAQRALSVGENESKYHDCVWVLIFAYIEIFNFYEEQWKKVMDEDFIRLINELKKSSVKLALKSSDNVPDSSRSVKSQQRESLKRAVLPQYTAKKAQFRETVIRAFNVPVTSQNENP